jgi:uncharacterized membrane protein
LNDFVAKFIRENWCKLLGGLGGLLIALAFVTFGFWKGILIIFLTAAGIYLGGKMEKKEHVQDFLNRFFNRIHF